MIYAELDALQQAGQLDADSTRFYYAVNKRGSKSTPEDAFLHQKKIALDARLKREAARHRPTALSIIPASSTSLSTSSSSSSAPAPAAAPDNIREQCRIIMDMLHFDPPEQMAVTNPLLLFTLPKRVQQLLLEETLTVEQAQVVLMLNGPDDQEELAERASHGRMSVREMQELIATMFGTRRCVNCPNQLSRQVCWGILELWCRGQLQTHHVRFLLRELMSVRLMEEVGDGARAPQRRLAAEEKSCFICRKFAQGVFEPSFSDVEQYRAEAPLPSADGIFDLLWLHRKQGLHVVKDVVQLALNHRRERETSWLLAVLGLETHVMLELAASHAFEKYLENLRGRLTDRLHQLDAKFCQPTQRRSREEDDDDDLIGIELRQVAADLDRLQEHCTAVELREQAQRRRAEEQRRREDQRRREEEDHRIKETFRYKHLVEQEVAALHTRIRARTMRERRRCAGIAEETEASAFRGVDKESTGGLGSSPKLDERSIASQGVAEQGSSAREANAPQEGRRAREGGNPAEAAARE